MKTADDAPSERLVLLLQELIRNACVNDGHSCSESRSVASLLSFFEEYGLEGTVLAKEPGRENLILRVPGTDPEAPSLAFMGHTDVVPADGADWDHDPFGGELLNGEVWGRGAVDMLNMTAAQAVGFAEAVTKHGPFPGDLLYIALADEEASGTCGARWLTEEHWDTVVCDYMVSEIGGFFIDNPLRSSAVIGVGEKGVAWLRIHAQGIPGHGSIPFGAENAADTILRAGNRLQALKFPPRMSRTYRGMAQACAESPLEALFLSIPLLQGRALKRMYRRRAGAARWLHAASRTTVSTGIVRGGTKINVIPDKASLDLDVRLLPGETLESLLDTLRRTLHRAGVEAEIEVLEYSPPTLSSGSGPLFEASSCLLKEQHPDAQLVPILIGGATDGRFWRRRGTSVCGFTIFGKEMTMDRFSTLLHGRNERVSVESLRRSLDYYTRLPETFFRLRQTGRS